MKSFFKKPKSKPEHDQKIDQVDYLKKLINSLTSENTSLKEALEIAQREINRLKTQVTEMRDMQRFDDEVHSTAMSINNTAKDETLVMAGTLNRAREVAEAMKTPLMLMNDAIPALPAPRSDDEEYALSVITDSLSELIRHAGMIRNDGKGVEDKRITMALNESKTGKREPEPVLYQGSGVEKRNANKEIAELKMGNGWVIENVFLQTKNSFGSVAVMCDLIGPSKNEKISFVQEYPTDFSLDKVKSELLKTMKNAISEYENERKSNV